VDTERRRVLQVAAKAVADFKRVFGRDLTPSLLGEIYVALELDLPLPTRSNEPGYDLLAADGTRYQVKVRSPSTLNVDVNNFDFDYLVLVNLSDDCGITGMWKLDVATAQTLFRHREKFRKHQATQVAVKNAAQKLDVSRVV
jgi:hypothetical protein